MTPGHNQGEIDRRNFVKVPDFDKDIFRKANVPQVSSDKKVAFHRTTDDSHAAAIFSGSVNGLLDAGDVGRKGGDKNPALSLTDFIFKLFLDL